MQITCQNCNKEFEAADSDAGKSIPCPHCQTEVRVPMLLSAPMLEPTVIGPAPGLPPMVTPPFIPPVIPPVVPPTVLPTIPPLLPEIPVLRIESAENPLPPGYTKFRLAKLPIKALQWTPAVALCVALIFSLFGRWVGLYPAGYGSYTQTGLQATFGIVSKNPVSEKEMKLAQPLNDRVGGNWLLLPYLMLLIAAAVTAIGILVFERRTQKASPGHSLLELDLDKRPAIPARLHGLWPHRTTILTIFIGLSLVLLLVQLWVGLGLEKAVNGMVKSNFETELAAAETDEEIQRVEIRIAMQQGSFHLTRTIWLNVVIFAEWLALVAVGVQILLRRRGDKPAPGVAALW